MRSSVVMQPEEPAGRGEHDGRSISLRLSFSLKTQPLVSSLGPASVSAALVSHFGGEGGGEHSFAALRLDHGHAHAEVRRREPDSLLRRRPVVQRIEDEGAVRLHLPVPGRRDGLRVTDRAQQLPLVSRILHDHQHCAAVEDLFLVPVRGPFPRHPDGAARSRRIHLVLLANILQLRVLNGNVCDVDVGIDLFELCERNVVRAAQRPPASD
mmetsp:Transcript_6243/g.12644  ORF Transcript_6243/g.12644 Transcript_6243/m.12644 type:complete len:211 (+) Transcript_6243:333-965(+)